MKPKSRLLVLGTVYSLSVLLAFELAGRTYFFARHGVQTSFWAPASQAAYRWYPNLQPVIEDRRTDCVRILVLGGSTLNRGWSDFEDQLHHQLSAVLPRDVCVFNTSMAARISLDYARSIAPSPSPVETWGLPENIAKGLEVHNNIIRQLAIEHPETFFVDQDVRLSHQPEQFIDVCHLSATGTRHFVENIIAELKRRGFDFSAEAYSRQSRDQKHAISPPRALDRTIPDQSMVYPASVPPAQFRPILNKFTAQQHPFTSGDQIVWQESRSDQQSEIYLYDLRTKTEQHILKSHGKEELFPKISGNRIISEALSSDGRREIRNSVVGTRPNISGDLAVWMGLRGPGPEGSERSNIFLYDFVTKRRIRIAKDSEYDEISPDLDGNRVVWQSLRVSRSGIYTCLYDRATGTCPAQWLVADDGGRTSLVGAPDVSGNLVVFDKVFLGTHEQFVYLYDLSTGLTRPVASKLGFQQNGQVSGNRIVWQDRRNGTWDIYYCEYDAATSGLPRTTNYERAMDSVASYDFRRPYCLGGLSDRETGHLPV